MFFLRKKLHSYIIDMFFLRENFVGYHGLFGKIFQKQTMIIKHNQHVSVL